MKICRNCGSANNNENNFCSRCGSSEFSEATDSIQPAAPAVSEPAPAYIYKKSDFTWYDVFTIFGFVASVIGCFVITLIIEPFALVGSVWGFSKGKRYKALAVAAIVIASISLFIRLFVTLCNIGALPRWIVAGTLG